MFVGHEKLDMVMERAALLAYADRKAAADGQFSYLLLNPKSACFPDGCRWSRVFSITTCMLSACADFSEIVILLSD